MIEEEQRNIVPFFAFLDVDLLDPLEFGALILKIMIKRMKKGEEIRSRWCVVLAGTKKKIGRRRSCV
jgi:hypothetical protein